MTLFLATCYWPTFVPPGDNCCLREINAQWDTGPKLPWWSNYFEKYSIAKEIFRWWWKNMKWNWFLPMITDDHLSEVKFHQIFQKGLPFQPTSYPSTYVWWKTDFPTWRKWQPFWKIWWNFTPLLPSRWLSLEFGMHVETRDSIGSGIFPSLLWLRKFFELIEPPKPKVSDR